MYKNSGNPSELAKPLVAATKDGFNFLHSNLYNNSLYTTSLALERVLEGKAYISSVTGSVEDNAILSILLTPSVDIYSAFEGGAGGDSYAALYENSVASGGVSMPVINRNRNHDSAPITIAKNVTVTATGNMLMESYIYGGQKSKSGGGAIGYAPIFVLKANTSYLVQMRNVSGSATFVSLSIDMFTW